MKSKLFFAFLASVLCAATALGMTASIVSSFVGPHGANWPKGLDYAGGYLYHASNYSTNRLYVTTTTGSITSTITCPTGTMGVEVDGSDLWTCSYSPAYIYKMTMAGSIVSSFAGPAAGYGLAVGGGYLWYSSATSDMIYKLTSAGSVVTSFSHPGSFAGDLDYANGYLYIADWPGTTGAIYQTTTTGSLVDSLSPTPGSTRPAGCCWDGTYLWYDDYSSPYRCTQVKLVYTGVEPTSMGRIKALYK